MSDTVQMITDLAGIVGEANVKTHADALTPYAVDEVMPAAVVFPKNTRQVSDIVKYANTEQLSVIPRGSGSKICLGNPPKKMDILLCTTRMNHMTDVDVANLTLTVEAGVKLLDIQARLATEDDRCYLPLQDLSSESKEIICSDRSHSGCFLPIDAPFGRRATIGGIIASNSSGPRRLLYNLPRDLILGARFVAPNGDIIGTGGKTVKNVSGYDISKLMIGSAGTLGILCEMTLRLLPLPEKMQTLVFSFESFANAVAFCNQIHETSLLPAAVEMMNDKAYECLKSKNMPDLKPGAYIVAVALEAFIEAVDRMRTEIGAMAARAERLAEACIEQDQHSLFWLAVSELIPSVSSRCSTLVSAKLNYPISCWGEIIGYANQIMSENGLTPVLQAHTGSGVCMMHFMLNGNASKQDIVNVLRKLLGQCKQAGGNLVIQHAPLEIKKELSVWGEPGSDLILMKQIKKALDPKGVMSPGRFVDNI
ncbi:MAG: FAD-binding oxidoreductase [Deltaproteobacteria bacterium]|nr:FAD-binding oxidoreductase [Deltaproteobacteria bacterium]MBW2150638.1 FAD-binding oxidoreductase [Deltaproteobacteria bacterium]